MDVETVKIGEVKPYGNNPRFNANAIDGVKQSLEAYGWQQPLVVDQDNTIIIGNTRYQAAKQLKMTEVPVIKMDKLSPEKVKALRIADNHTAEIADWDMDKLFKELNGLESGFYTGFDFEKMLQTADKALNELNEESKQQKDQEPEYTLYFSNDTDRQLMLTVFKKLQSKYKFEVRADD